MFTYISIFKNFTFTKVFILEKENNEKLTAVSSYTD